MEKSRSLFSDFNHLFELLDPVLLPIAEVPFILWNENEFRMRRLSESRGGSKMTKPISSNSGKHYWDAAQDKAFEEVKRLLKQAPVLAYFNLTLRRNCLFVVTTVRKVWEPISC